MKRHLTIINLFLIGSLFSQLPVARDTITVIENNYVLKMPWSNGINSSNISSMDVNMDGIKDLVVFDRMNESGMGRFRCFIKTGSPGDLKFRSDPGISYSFPQASYWAVLFDYNGDGKEDLFCSTTGGIKVYQNTSGSYLSFKLVKSLLMTKYSSGGMLTNLYASSIGVPGIADIDKDGDLDVLSFSPFGVYIEYHKNISKETYGHSDSLEFRLEDYCWGDISESSCTVDMTPCGFKMAYDSLVNKGSGIKHAGSCLTCIDFDSDNDQDLIMGDVACNTVVFGYNSGSSTNALISDTTKLYPNFPIKNNTTQIRISNFPCTYYVDVDGDSKKDLVATPNAYAGENFRSVWLYKNTSSTGTVNFQFVKNNFLQDEMIDVGQNSFPVLFDYNADGKKDLLIGTYGYFENGSLVGKLTLYENTGTIQKPVFKLVTRDYCNVSSHGLNYVMPSAGDIDGDGDTDICIGTSSGQIHWLENTAGAGNVCNFSIFKNNPFSFTTLSAASAPQIFDLDKDGKADLLIGGKNGRIAYYKNTGGTGSPSFSLVSNYLGNVDVKSNPNIFANEGYAVPFFFNEGTNTFLLVGSVDGRIFYYNVPGASSNFNLETVIANGLLEGVQSTPCYEDINNDGKRDLFVGNASGGLSFFSSSSPFVNIGSSVYTESELAIYPVPANDLIYFNFDSGLQATFIVSIYDVVGKKIIEECSVQNKEGLEISSLDPGIYVARVETYVNGRKIELIKKIIKQ
jgi:hypothetical protein